MTLAEQEICTHYANTDLKIGSDTEPLALTAIFHRHQFCNMTEQTLEDGTWLGRYETGEQYIEPDSNIAGFLDVVEGLEGTALKEWQKCTLREFDIGYMAGYEPFCFEQMLTVETLSRVVKAGFVIRLTIYAADPIPGRCRASLQQRDNLRVFVLSCQHQRRLPSLARYTHPMLNQELDCMHLS